MYANIFFIILLLLLIDIAPQISRVDMPSVLTFHSAVTLTLAYAVVLIVIALQNVAFKTWLRRHKERFLILANIELLAFFCFAYFYLGAAALFDQISWLQNSPLLKLLLPLSAYFLGIEIFHYFAKGKPSHLSSSSFTSRCASAFLEVRMLLPFVIPVIALTALKEIALVYPQLTLPLFQTWLFATFPATVLSLMGTALFFAIMMIILPPLMQWIWKCQPLEDGPLKERFEALCQKAHFKHAGIQVWGVMKHAITAAIIGVVPRFRYVLFTPRILHEMPPECLEAVLCHEIGHSYRKHLLLYPFILMGMVVCTALYAYFFTVPVIDFLNANLENNSFLWYLSYPLAYFIPFALIIWIYFRSVFGFFSRLFERQADLHVFKLNLNPVHMIEALDFMGNVSGYTHDVPNWHHYSLRERIDFLEFARQHPSAAKKHDRFVKKMLFLYFSLLMIISVYLLTV